MMRACPVLILCLGCAAAEDDGSDPTAADTRVYHCASESPANGVDSARVVARRENDKLHLWLPPELGKVHQILSAETEAGSYSASGTNLLIAADTATLTMGSARVLNCMLDRRQSIWEHAKLNGADFRAVGNEPGWHLEIREATRMDFVYDYGAHSLTVPLSDTLREEARTTFIGSSAGRELRVQLEPGPCADSMSDETFSTRVRVNLDGATYTGCGEPLH